MVLYDRLRVTGALCATLPAVVQGERAAGASVTPCLIESGVSVFHRDGQMLQMLPSFLNDHLGHEAAMAMEMIFFKTQDSLSNFICYPK